MPDNTLPESRSPTEEMMAHYSAILANFKDRMSLTQAEERYAKSWLEMGISEELIGLAYEKTCVNTGGLSWPYMNKILSSWHAAGYKTAADVQNQDRKTTVPKGASGELGQAELEAIRRVLQEG